MNACIKSYRNIRGTKQPGWGGGGEGLPYVSHVGMCRPKEYGFLRRFGLTTGIDFAHFGLESGIVFRELRWCINIFFDWFHINRK